MPNRPGGVETPRSAHSLNPTSPDAPASSFTNASKRPFGAALGLDHAEVPRKPDDFHAQNSEDEQLFTVKVCWVFQHPRH